MNEIPFEMQNDWLQKIYIAICNGEEVFQCSRGAFALPSPQRSGTSMQQHTYAVQKAREVFEQIVRAK